MGSKHSSEKRSSHSSTAPLVPEKPEPTNTTPTQSPLTHSPIQKVSPPARHRELTHLSSLIDPTDLTGDWKARSPSGNLLGPKGYFSHPERPLSMRERREEIVRRCASQEGTSNSGLGLGLDVMEEKVGKKKSRSCCW